MTKQKYHRNTPESRYFSARKSTGDGSKYVVLSNNPLPVTTGQFHRLPENVKLEIIEEKKKLDDEIRNQPENETHRVFEHEKEENMLSAFKKVIPKHYPEVYKRQKEEVD